MAARRQSASPADQDLGDLVSVDSILDTIGSTPLLRLTRFGRQSGLQPVPGGATLWAKLENLEPGGSVKDRAAQSMIAAAERAGLLTPDSDPPGVVVEPTSGNTGIGLGMVCAARGYRLILTMPENMSAERRALLASYGAELVLTPASALMEGAIAKARALAAQIPGAFLPQQFENPANPAAHLASTGPEIAAALEEAGVTPSAFVAGVGTGGTLTGAGRALRERFPKMQIIAVEPRVSAVLSGYSASVTRIQGLGAGFVPPILDRSLIDRVVPVSDEDAWDTRNALAKSEGLLAGISAGAALWAAREVGRELGRRAHVVTVIPDTGERYFSLGAEFA
jgi:cysteine synthase A